MDRRWTKVGALFVCVLFVFLLAPIPRTGNNGAYNTFSRLMWCRTESACLHETGHRLDQEAGWISHSAEFGEAAQTYVLVEFSDRTPSDLSITIMSMPGVFYWNGYFIGDRPSEIYATVFEYSEGTIEKMPDVFRRYYDWQNAQELIKRGETWRQYIQVH